MANIWVNSMACHPRTACHIAGCCHLTNSVSWSQSYVSHCRVLPLGEFTVMISEPHATLQGVIISSGILKIVFRHILFFLFFFNAVGLWRVAAFVSSDTVVFFCVLICVPVSHVAWNVDWLVSCPILFTFFTLTLWYCRCSSIEQQYAGSTV